jgi:hypothetical protein
VSPCGRAHLGTPLPPVPQAGRSTGAALRIDVGIAKSRGGKIQGSYAGPGIAIPKGKHLKFTIVGGAPSGPVQYEWTVTNTGDEATAAADIEHKNASRSSECWEHTAYGVASGNPPPTAGRTQRNGINSKHVLLTCQPSQPLDRA